MWLHWYCKTRSLLPTQPTPLDASCSPSHYLDNVAVIARKLVSYTTECKPQCMTVILNRRSHNGQLPMKKCLFSGVFSCTQTPNRHSTRLDPVFVVETPTCCRRLISTWELPSLAMCPRRSDSGCATVARRDRLQLSNIPPTAIPLSAYRKCLLPARDTYI